MSDTVQCWTKHEREFRIDDNEAYKRSFRPAEYKLTQRNEPYIPPLGFERLANEAACPRFVREKTNFPVPEVLKHVKTMAPLCLLLDGFSVWKHMIYLPNIRRS